MLIFDEINLASDNTSDIIDLTNHTGARPNGAFIFFQWYNVTGTEDGKFTIYAYAENDADATKPFLAGFDNNTVTVSGADNTSNCTMVAIPFGIQKLKIIYEKNSITAGVGNVNILEDYR